MGRIKPQALLLQSKKKKGPSRISVTTIITSSLIVILIVLSLYATYKRWYQRASNQLGTSLHNFEHIETFEEPKKDNRPSYAILNTSKGLITVEIYKDASPDVVDKFIGLCRKGYFKGMLFHHVIKYYVIEGGENQRLGATEDWTLKGKAHSQLAISPKHEAFMFGTAKAKQDLKGFELFITTAPIPDLNDKLIVFGRVIKGEDVVQVTYYGGLYCVIPSSGKSPARIICYRHVKEIEEVDTDEHYRPKSPIGIIDITPKQEL